MGLYWICLQIFGKGYLFCILYMIEPGDTPLMKKQLLTETEYRENKEKYGNRFEAGRCGSH